MGFLVQVCWAVWQCSTGLQDSLLRHSANALSYEQAPCLISNANSPPYILADEQVQFENEKGRVMKNALKQLGWILCLAVSLGFLGCAGTQTKESTGEVIDNSAITAKIKAALVDDPMVSAMQIKVKSFRGVVQLSGFVDTEQQKERAQKIAEGIDGVREVRNDIVVKSQVSRANP